MSGIEIAGLVLGGFPILLNCLDYYQRGFEPLEEWWNFRSQFIAFVDGMSHQMMKYHQNLIELLDPVVADSESLRQLIDNPNDPRWRDGSLAPELEKRLASEHPRFLRIIDRMQGVIHDLKKLLQVDEANPPWVGDEGSRSWEWHFKRMQFAFSKGKQKKVQKLDGYNTELKEILKYSDRIIPISDSRKSSPPVALLEKLRQHASNVHDAIRRSWKCHLPPCYSHHANLSIDSAPTASNLNILFMIQHGQNSIVVKREVMFEPESTGTTIQTETEKPISHVQPAESLVQLQTRFEGAKDTKSSFRSKFTNFLKKPDPLKGSKRGSSPGGSSHSIAASIISAPSIRPAVQIQFQPEDGTAQTTSVSGDSLILDLCKSLQSSQDNYIGKIEDEYGRAYNLAKLTTPLAKTVPEGAMLVPLPKLLHAHYLCNINLSRGTGFEMAANIASALLQVHLSPWLPQGWSKNDFCFLADSKAVYSCRPFVSRCFMANSIPTASIDDASQLVVDEEGARAALLSIGIIILELIFGHRIEDCGFRRNYYGADNAPNDQTDFSTALKWQQKVPGECGEDIADVVRRCLLCSFGPRPGFQNKDFREAVYEGVIRPLINWEKPIPQVMS